LLRTGICRVARERRSFEHSRIYLSARSTRGPGRGSRPLSRCRAGATLAPVDAREGADDRERALEAAHVAALDWLRSLEERPAWPRASLDEMLEVFGGPLPEQGSDPAAVVEQLAAGAGPG